MYVITIKNGQLVFVFFDNRPLYKVLHTDEYCVCINFILHMILCWSPARSALKFNVSKVLNEVYNLRNHVQFGINSMFYFIIATL